MTTTEDRSSVTTRSRRRPRRPHAATGARILVAGAGTAATIALASLMTRADIEDAAPAATPTEVPPAEPASDTVNAPASEPAPPVTIQVVVRRAVPATAGSTPAPAQLAPAPARIAPTAPAAIAPPPPPPAPAPAPAPAPVTTSRAS